MRIVLVTGSNRGIGREIARQLVERDCEVIVTARDEAAARETADELGATMGLVLDVTDEQSVQAAASTVEDRFGRLDVLVNNAGVMSQARSIEDLSDEDMERTLDANLYGPLRMTRALLTLLEASDDPRIVNVSSGAGSLSEGGGAKPAYAVSKTALNMLTVKTAQFTRVRANAMCPGWVRTDMGGENAARSLEEGADTAVWLALDADENGGFFRDRERIDW